MTPLAHLDGVPAGRPGRRRHVGRGRQLGDRGAAGRGRLRGRRRHAPALRPWCRQRPQGRLLRRARHPRRTRGRRRAWASPTTSSTSRRASRRRVIDDFAASYAAGRTPIPCVRCNERIKFTDLLGIARDLGAAALATGHYVRRAPGPGRPRAAPRRRPGQGPELLPVRDHARSSWTSCAFRWAASTRPTIRAHAQRLGLAVADKPDSQDICFVPSGHYSDVVARLRPDAFAARRDRPRRRPRARPPRRHGPLHRRPAARPRTSPTASGSTSSASSPSAAAWWSARATPATALDRSLTGRQLAGRSPRCQAGGGQASLQRARRCPAGSSSEPDGRAQVALDEPQPGVAPGQACVCYAGTPPPRRRLDRPCHRRLAVGPGPAQRLTPWAPAHR